MPRVPLDTDTLDSLEAHEPDALVSAAAWYVNRHGRMIAEQADDPSVAAI